MKLIPSSAEGQQKIEDVEYFYFHSDSVMSESPSARVWQADILAF